ncbi:hypothetical protein EYC84_005329 [Monilinia fructicola]|uniref:DNA repair metallo-beta-lactamase domain-containing protein n=1 Tax=Monilinia fructicola TaxID=38448 RepID=A0A5M9JYM9_MONFR|nr:hypothetical protein EYC84_005329 [Monilinia fructicola]
MSYRRLSQKRRSGTWLWSRIAMRAIGKNIKFNIQTKLCVFLGFSQFNPHGLNHLDNPFKDDDSLFVAQRSGAVVQPPPEIADDDLYGINDEGYDEAERSIKKRKLSDETNTEDSSIPTPPLAVNQIPIAKGKSSRKPPRRSGPFLDDSDSEEESMEAVLTTQAQTHIERKQPGNSTIKSIAELGTKQEHIVEEKSVIPSTENTLPLGSSVFKLKKRVPVKRAQAEWEAKRVRNAKAISSPDEKPEYRGAQGTSITGSQKKSRPNLNTMMKRHRMAIKTRIASPKAKESAREKSNSHPETGTLKEENTSTDTWEEFEGMGEFPDEDVDGEEFMERKFMEEQNNLEAVNEAQTEEDSFNGFDDDLDASTNLEEERVSICPMCNASLNGKPIPLPAKAKAKAKVPTESSEAKLMPDDARSRYSKKAAIPRPGQANPIELENNGGSAFSKIMSGNIEDAAWASAADKEKSSRGKPAYQRTCPFYKIMPGLSICVDAFRYGAVKDCKAYFLSHFHSDHYVGLTSTWSHGPIYCSRITGNLVIQQLKVDAKWVVTIDFDSKVQVPDTQGVSVTMIPANHCPGSSLFLFEKSIGRGSNPKVQRILHCGDFRACPAHIAHPLLMPNVVDSVNGKTKQQKIDICYLDTTYLNPKFAFPSQDDVVQACADMCVSLSKENAEECDAWETAKRERAGAKMTKFINSAPKTETDDLNTPEASSKDKKKARGRLLVVCGTYSIGKEHIVLGVARALDCKIYAIPSKMRICAALEDPELTSRLTSDPLEAQIHMQMIMDLRPETLQDYLSGYKPHFTRVVGFRPSGWSYKPPNSRFIDSPPIHTILHAPNWRSEYNMGELVPQRGSTKEAQCFGVPYSEHSSFRELTMFVMGLRIEKVIPTVNVGSELGRKKMKVWIDRWLTERRKHGVLKFGG